MQFVMLIYQGTTPTPTGEAWKLSWAEEEKKRIFAEYEAINKTPGVTPGLPLGLPENAITVRVKDGQTVTAQGPFVDAKGAVGGYYVLEAENLDAAIKMASRIPAARLGGAIEVRPVAKYW
jgi:hypothetical protein